MALSFQLGITRLSRSQHWHRIVFIIFFFYLSYFYGEENEEKVRALKTLQKMYFRVTNFVMVTSYMVSSLKYTKKSEDRLNDDYNRKCYSSVVATVVW